MRCLKCQKDTELFQKYDPVTGEMKYVCSICGNRMEHKSWKEGPAAGIG